MHVKVNNGARDGCLANRLPSVSVWLPNLLKNVFLVDKFEI